MVPIRGKERIAPRNRMNFGKVPKGGGGVIFNPKIYVADFKPYTGLKEGFSEKNLQHEIEGGSKVVWIFSENSSNLVAPSVPKQQM